MNWEGLSVVLAVAAFFGTFTSVIAWAEARSEADRLARQARRFEDYVRQPVRWQLPANSTK